jgi:hypothetical protein
MTYSTRTEQRQYHYSIEPTIQEVDKDMRDLSDAQIERLAARSDLSALGSRPWENWTTEERRAVRASNEHARRQREAQRAAEEAEKSRKIEQAHQARVDAQIAAYRQRVRSGFPGTDVQFEAAWPRILEDWQISEATRKAADLDAEMRQRVGGF